MSRIQDSGFKVDQEHFEKDQHDRSLKQLEENWKDNNKARDSDALRMLPQYLCNNGNGSLWDSTQPMTVGQAIAGGSSIKREHYADAQFVLSRCHHRWHPKNSAGARMPLA